MSGAAAPVAAQSASDAIASVRAFAEQYQREAPSLVAHEDYVQNATATYRRRTAEHQVTTAELVMVTIAGRRGLDLVSRCADREQAAAGCLATLVRAGRARSLRIAPESRTLTMRHACTRTTNVPDSISAHHAYRCSRANAARIQFEARAA